VLITAITRRSLGSVSDFGKRLRDLDDARIGPPKVYEPPTVREARLYGWSAFLGSAFAASALLLLPDHNSVKYLEVPIGLILVQPFVQDRANRRIQR